MPVKLNSEFNYRYQIIGETPWEKIKQLHGFLEGRKQALAMQEVSEIKKKAKIAEIEHLKNTDAPEYLIMRAEAELLEDKAFWETQDQGFKLAEQEIQIIENLLAEVYAIAEPTRIPGYTDEQMFEINAANEFTAMIGKEIYAEIMANGHASPAKLRNAMSNPHTMNALKNAGLLPEPMQYIEGGSDPLNIGLKCTVMNTHTAVIENTTNQVLKLDSTAPNHTSEVFTLFATPLHCAAYGQDISEEHNYILGLEYIESDASSTKQSSNNFILELKELQNIKQFIEQQIELYCSEVLQIKEKLYITQSWINYSPKGAGHPYHTHPNSIISGVFYFSLDDTNPPIVFWRPYPSSLAPNYEAPNVFNMGNYRSMAKTKNLLIFPSNTPHSVTPNLSDTPRISLSFNTFTKDPLGQKEQLTYLVPQ